MKYFDTIQRRALEFYNTELRFLFSRNAYSKYSVAKLNGVYVEW